MPSTKRIVGVALPVVVGLIATAILLLLLGARPAAAAGTRYVAPGGDDVAGANDCTNSGFPCQTVQHALDVAIAGDSILVAQGTYTSAAGTVADITQTVTLQGGWNSAFSQNDPASHPTVLDGQSLAPVVIISPTTASVSGQVSPTVEDVTITHGRGITDGCPVGFATNSPECGGGIKSLSADPLILDNVITNNVGGNNAQEADGGGIFLYNASASALISGNLVISNVANLDGLGLGVGGGIMEYSGLAAIRGNQIWQNHDSLVAGKGQGAGVQLTYSPINLIGNDIRGNASTNRGGGLWVTGATPGTVVISGNTFLSNTALVQGGALLINDTLPALISNNTIAYNRAISTTAGRGGGIRVSVDTAGVTIAHNDFYSNVSGWGGGSAIDLAVTGLVDGNDLHQNQNGQWGAALVLSGSLPLTATNNVIVDNQGAGIEAIDFGSSVSVVNNTVAGNHNASGGAPGEGMLITWDLTPAGTVTATVVNNLLVTEAGCGLDVNNPPAVTFTLFTHHNDVFSNSPNYCHAASSLGNFSANPQFVNAPGGDYHLGPASSAINAGSNAEAPATDRDGISRPQGPRVDIGAYEYMQPIAGLRAVNSSPTVFGQATAFTASVTAGDSVSYRWAFGNGVTGSGATPTYTYPALGYYTALVTATNSLASVTATTAVTVDDRPVAVGYTYSTTADVPLHVAAPGVLANDSDTFPGELTAQVAVGPAAGTLVLAPTGAFTYTPPLGFGGLVTFTYQANDSVLLSAPAPVTITVNAFELFLPLVQR